MRCVLIADDSDTLRGAFSKLFQDSGWTVLEARNGREAIEVAEQYHPEIVIMDVAMPVMDGVQAALVLTEKMPDVQIIMCSLYSTDEGINGEMYRSGIRNVLTKADAFHYLVPT